MNEASLRTALLPLLEVAYPGAADTVADRLLALGARWAPRLAGRTTPPPDQSTAYLITYGDAVRAPGETPLHTLHRLLHEHVGDVVTDVHLLPTYPWTSDDGFAVVDHRQIDPDLGSWHDVEELARGYAPMLDFVANHVSSASPWFTGWLADEPERADFFLAEDPAFDVSRVVRPRTTPLFHRYLRPDETPVSAWTTFGDDQVDVNAANVEVLLELTDVLLGYVTRGARTVRLDAIGYLWKQSGTSCIHLPQTHAVIKVWRALLDHLAPGTRLITETNVPHAENVAYFGNGRDEAGLVYQFALPPLVLHAFLAGDAAPLSRWASGIGPVSESATWFNFLASHDGIGLRPVEGLLSEAQLQALVEHTTDSGGLVSMAARPDGGETVYELNIGYLDALTGLHERDDARATTAKGLAAHSILFSVVGVPAVYYHSLFGSSSDLAAVRSSGIARRVNRQRLDADRLLRELSDDPRRHGMFEGLLHLLAVRRGLPGFSPFGTQDVEQHDERAFVVRRAAGTPDEVLAVTNVTPTPLELPQLGGMDVLTGRTHERLSLPGYGFAWLRPG